MGSVGRMRAALGAAAALVLLTMGGVRCGGSRTMGVGADSDVDSGADASACFCCSGSRGALLPGDVGDAGDCSWCPVTSECVHFVGGGFGGTPPPKTPDFVCATSVPNGGTGGPGSTPCQ